MRRTITIIIAIMMLLVLTACQPTPDTAPVQNKGGSLIDVISGDHEYKTENAAVLDGQTWSEQIFKTEDIDVTVDARILTQNVKGYPCVRVKDDTEKFMYSPYLEKMVSYFFNGLQPHYRTMEPTKKECEMRTLILQHAISSGRILEDMADQASQQLKKYKNEYITASNDIPFNIEEDPYGEKYLRETGMDNRIGLITYPDDGLAFIDIGKDHLAFGRQTYLYDYYYEIGLNSLDDVPESVHMDAENALKIVQDSVSTIAAGNDMELVRIATINKSSMYLSDINDFQTFEPECLVFYFMRSYGGVQSTCFTPSVVQFNLNEGDPQYGPGIQPERIRVIIDDSKIVEWTWIFPGMTTDVISDDVPLMPFEQVKDIFRQQVKNRYTYISVNGTETISVSKIVLGLMKISEKDSNGSYLVIPVWDFIGTQKVNSFGFEEGGDADYTFLTINAIDGSIINREFGY